MSREETPGDAAAGAYPAEDRADGRPAGRARPSSRRGGMKTFTSLQNNPDYRYLFAGNLFANAAQWLQFISIGWLALEVSGSPFHSIMAVAVRAVPTLVLGPWGGVLADRMDRRKLAMITQVGMCAAALAFAVLLVRDQVTNVGYVYAYTLVTGVGFAIKQPVRQALIANTVRPPDMANALALNALTVTSMRLVGAGMGGILIEFLGFHWNFFVEAGLYVGMLLLLIPMSTPYQKESTARHASPLGNLTEGLGYIVKNRLMLRLMLLNFVRTAVFAPLLLLLPSYTVEALGAGAGIGTAMIVTMGVGGVTATFIMSSWGFFTRKGLVCLITLLCGSIVITSLGLSHWVWYSVPIMVVMGFCQSHFIVANQTLIQTIVPDTLRGRVSSVWHYEQGLIPMFSGLIGLVAALVGISMSMTIFGGVAVLLSALFLLRFGDLRRLD
jgi:MFS family permease